MFYIEFIHWDRSVPLEIFRFLGQQSSGWKEKSPDRLVLQLGRTLRLGPEPAYLAVWEIPNFRRLDEWETYFRSTDSAPNRRSQAMHKAITIERAGLYKALRVGNLESYPLFYLEFYPAVSNDLLKSIPNEKLLYLFERVGYLGPQWAGLAIWGCEDFEDVEHLSVRRDPDTPPPADAGVYRNFGDEVI